MIFVSKATLSKPKCNPERIDVTINDQVIHYQIKGINLYFTLLA